MDVTVKTSATLISLSLALILLTAPVPSLGQQTGKVYRIGRLAGGLSPNEVTPQNCPRKGGAFWEGWVAGLRDRGYVQGQNLVVTCRYTEGLNERAQALAAELVALKLDLIVAANTNQVRAAKQATSTIPIVMHGVIDPVRRGLVSSLARPGGNVTGLTDDAGLEILGKYLQLLMQTVPTATRIAALRNRGALGDPSTLWGGVLEEEAQALGVTLQPYLVGNSEELEAAFAGLTKARAEALLVVPSPFFVMYRHRIVGLAAQHRLPAMYPDREDVEAGGLMAYALDEGESGRRVAAYVDRILQGAKPGELPVEQPTKFTLILNLKTAKALGLTIPPALLIQAEEVLR